MWSLIDLTQIIRARYNWIVLCEFNLVENRGQEESFHFNAAWTLFCLHWLSPPSAQYLRPHSLPASTPCVRTSVLFPGPALCLLNSSRPSASAWLVLGEALHEAWVNHILPAILHDVLFHHSTCHNFNSIIVCLIALMSVPLLDYQRHESKGTSLLFNIFSGP